MNVYFVKCLCRDCVRALSFIHVERYYAALEHGDRVINFVKCMCQDVSGMCQDRPGSC